MALCILTAERVGNHTISLTFGEFCMNLRDVITRPWFDCSSKSMHTLRALHFNVLIWFGLIVPKFVRILHQYLWKHGPYVRYVKLRGCACVGNAGNVTHVPWCMPESLTSSFVWSRWRGRRSWYSRRMRIPQFFVSGKRSMRLKKPWRI